ncbi:putative AbiEii toxin of type IV toxin-antitoxin system [Pseudonocardia hierapolitana]|uniref:Putative AbiEii toxin of type IV toxin-antitoxin system n=1 Tax=Pseudonocardia hierapolitana TaxID=1128676 RepID=A0A561SZY3_9PSEU|nr:putative AbiEii toxin of type IV toxin-antitoxin system [Pseudonocardia hierapolitana]
MPLAEVGALLDAGAVHGGRTAYDHLLALAASNGLPRRRVAEVLARTGMDGVARRRAGEFSLGMRQRLGIAATLLGDPRVLIFDEPVNGLDPEGIRWIRDFMRSLAREGRAVLVSSHLMSEMAQTADHLVVIGRGRLIADTGMSEFMRGRWPVPTTGTSNWRRRWGRAPASGCPCPCCTTRRTGPGVHGRDDGHGRPGRRVAEGARGRRRRADP